MNRHPRGAGYATPLLAYGAAALLLADWVALAALLMRSCGFPYEGGNITVCAGGLSEEQTLAASGLGALMLLAAQIRLIALVRRTR